MHLIKYLGHCVEQTIKVSWLWDMKIKRGFTFILFCCIYLHCLCHLFYYKFFIPFSFVLTMHAPYSVPVMSWDCNILLRFFCTVHVRPNSMWRFWSTAGFLYKVCMNFVFLLTIYKYSGSKISIEMANNVKLTDRMWSEILYVKLWSTSHFLTSTFFMSISIPCS